MTNGVGTRRPGPIGFSTGSLALGDYRAALASLRSSDASAVELSALREPELAPLMDDLSKLPLSQFRHISVHAPSSFPTMDEAQIVAALQPAIDARYPIIVHADVISVPARWEALGDLLCIENMDKRKQTGRTVEELKPLFEELPHARLCLDLAHARQVDPSLCESVLLLEEFRGRLAQIHLSELSAQSRHESFSHAAVAAFQSLSRLIPASTPVILEFEAPPATLSEYIGFTGRMLQPTIIRVRNVG